MMKRAGLLAVVLAGGFFAYRYFSGDAVEARYRAFAEEILHRRYDTAATMADGLTAGDLGKLGSQERIGGPAMFQTLFPSRFVVDSRANAPDGSVVLHATQTVLFNPVGVESAVRPAMFATLKQVVTLHKSAGEWKVTAFENTFDRMDTLSSR